MFVRLRIVYVDGVARHVDVQQLTVRARGESHAGPALHDFAVCDALLLEIDGPELVVPDFTVDCPRLPPPRRQSKTADRRVWPSIDITQSGTRREELLHDADTLDAVTMLRRTLTSMHHVDAMEQLTKQLGRFQTNDEFIKLISGVKVLD